MADIHDVGVAWSLPAGLATEQVVGKLAEFLAQERQLEMEVVSQEAALAGLKRRLERIKELRGECLEWLRKA